MLGRPPPTGVPPERLWRLLLGLPGRPYPEQPIDYRLPFAPAVALSVRAVPALLLSRAWDDAEGQPSRGRRGVLAAVLWTPMGRAFKDARDAGMLREAYADPLIGAVDTALDAICPTYARSDVVAWLDVLKAGARHYTNLGPAHVLAGCVGHPERYWGIPVGEMADGHHMAMVAARTATEKK
jgi:hypothetical protein